MNKTTDEVKRMLKEQWDKACYGYLVELARMWEWDSLDEYGYWIDGVGSVFSYGDLYSIDMEDAIYCVEHDVTSEEYLEHTDYWLKCDEYNFNKLSLKAWHEGAPRIPQEVFDKLDALKKSLEDEIDNVKKQF